MVELITRTTQKKTNEISFATAIDEGYSISHNAGFKYTALYSFDTMEQLVNYYLESSEIEDLDNLVSSSKVIKYKGRVRNGEMVINKKVILVSELNLMENLQQAIDKGVMTDSQIEGAKALIAKAEEYLNS